jgi:hypothetical protein
VQYLGEMPWVSRATAMWPDGSVRGERQNESQEARGELKTLGSSRAQELLNLLGFALGLIHPLRKLFQKFRETIRNRFRKIRSSCRPEHVGDFSGSKSIRPA